jgi:hypothetical protein
MEISPDVNSAGLELKLMADGFEVYGGADVHCWNYYWLN